MNAIGPIQDPDLRSLLLALKSEISYGVNCHQVGTIVSFDAATQTARVQLAMVRVVYNQEQAIGAALQQTPQLVEYPVLVDCPVFVLAGGTGVVTLPITTGDTCLVCFNDRDIDTWFSTGTTSVAPPSPRAHSLSDGFALVGFRSKRNPVGAYSTTDLELRNLGGKIAVAAKIGISNADTSLLNVLNLIITALTALNAKTGPSAAAQIASAQAGVTSLLQ